MREQGEMNVLIPEKLKEIEKEYDVTVLWAVESGSRAWGFASPDSDFDVRFIYKRKPEAYLKLNKGRNVIELPIDDTWDVSGWDLGKTLILLQKSNPTLYEWLNSPIRYSETDFARRLQPLMRECFSEEKMLYHYLNMAKRNRKDYLQGNLIKPKKYFYSLRPVLACIWVMKYHKAPPVLFDELCRSVLPKALNGPVNHLLEIKTSGPEKMEISQIKEIDEFLDERIMAVENHLQNTIYEKKEVWDNLNRFFIEELQR